jgi:hypothetical protein
MAPLARCGKVSRGEYTTGKESKRTDCGKKEETGDFSSINLYKTETILKNNSILLLFRDAVGYVTYLKYAILWRNSSGIQQNLRHGHFGFHCMLKVYSNHFLMKI